MVTRRGKDAVVVVGADEYQRLAGGAQDFKAFLLSDPDLSQLDLDSEVTRADELYLSPLTAGEIRRGIERLRRRDAGQAGTFEAWLATLRRDFAQRVLPITADIADA